MTHWIVACAGASAVVFSTLMLAQRSLYAAAVCFLAVILQVSVLLYASGARLLALLLLLIYAGAVAVLIVVSIQACGRREGPALGSRWSRLGLPWALAAAGLLLPVLDGGLLLFQAGTRLPVPGPASDLILGPALFGPYAAAAEAVALLMLFASLAVIGDPEEKR